MKPAAKWHSVLVEYERVEVGTGEWIQLVHTDRDGKFHIIELQIATDGTIMLTTDLPVRSWADWKAAV